MGGRTKAIERWGSNDVISRSRTHPAERRMPDKVLRSSFPFNSKVNMENVQKSRIDMNSGFVSTG